MALEKLSTPSLAALYVRGKQQSEFAHEVLELGPAEYFRRVIALSQGSEAETDRLHHQYAPDALVEAHDRGLLRPFSVSNIRESMAYDTESWPISQVAEAFGWVNQANRRGRGVERAVQWLSGMTGALDSHLQKVEDTLRARLELPGTRELAESRMADGGSAHRLTDVARALLAAAPPNVEAQRVRSDGPSITF